MHDPLADENALIRPATARLVTATTSTNPKPVTAPFRGKESIPLAVLRGVARRWRLVVTVGFLSAASVGSLLWFVLPPALPTATAKLYIPLKASGSLGEHPDPPLERQTQAELIKSRFVLDRAIQAREVANLPAIKSQEDPLEWLAKNLKVEFLGPEIFRISLSYADADQAKVLVDAIKDSYLRDVANKSSTDRSQKLQRLNDLAASQRVILNRKRQTVKDLAKDSGLFETERRVFIQQTLQFQMQEARRQLTRAESELRAAKIREEAFTDKSPLEISDSLLDKYVEADRRVQESTQELKAHESDLEAVLKIARRKDQKEVVEAEQKLAAGRRAHEEIRTRLRGEIREQYLSQVKVERSLKLEHSKNERTLLEQQATQLRAELDAYAKTLSDDRATANDIAPFQFEIKQTEELLGTILKSVTHLTIEQETPPRVLPLENASVTRVNETHRKALITGVGAGAGFFLVVLLVGLAELKFRRVDSVNGTQQWLGLRMVWTLPKPRSSGQRWWTASSGVQGIAEAIAYTRTMLMYGEGLSPHRVLLITSPVSGEGKTTLSMQLAASVSAAGRKILLIDADLRNPTVHKRLGMSETPGLCEVLRDEASVFDVVRETTLPGLMFIPAGNWRTDTPRAMASEKLGQVLAVWKEQFDFIIVDSSPVLPVTDALLLSRHVDGVILSLLHGVSRLGQATEAIQRFTSLGVRVLGAVVNGTSHQSYGKTGKYYTTPASETSVPSSEPS